MLPQPYGCFLKQVAAQLAVATGGIAAHAPDKGGVGAQRGIEYLDVVHSDNTIPLWKAKSDSREGKYYTGKIPKTAAPLPVIEA